MFIANVDFGTVVPSDMPALIIDYNKGPQLLLPKRDDSAMIPKVDAVLTAIMLKLNDEEWVNDLLEEAFGNDAYARSSS